MRGTSGTKLRSPKRMTCLSICSVEINLSDLLPTVLIIEDGETPYLFRFLAIEHHAEINHVGLLWLCLSTLTVLC